MSGSLKRKFEEGSAPFLSLQGSEDDEVSCSDSGDSSDSVNPPILPAPIESSPPQPKRPRGRSVQFDRVTVYYFSRRQGFTSVPTQGGSSLGMSPRHSWVQQFTLREFAMEQERGHRDMLREHLKEEKLNTIKLKLTENGAASSAEAEALTLDDVSEDDLDLDNAEVDEYFYLQPLTTRRRRALLRASGVRRIDADEKRELRALRGSREECGCHCRGGACDPETCACSLAGIQCQVDRMSFPCGCTKEGCSNRTGRLEFNPVRVRTHFLHTIMKLELERSSEEPPPRHRSPAVTNGNGYHGDCPSAHHLPQQQMQLPPGLPFPLMNGAPHLPIMQLQNASDTDSQLDEEEEDEEDEEDEDEEAYDEEGSSLCSGLSDCSTHSLETDEEDEEDEDDDGDEDDEDDADEEEAADSWRCPPPYTHTDVVPLSAALGFTSSLRVNINRPADSSAEATRASLGSELSPGPLHTGPHCPTGRQSTVNPLTAQTASESPPSKTSHLSAPECDTAPAGETGEQQLVTALQNGVTASRSF